MCECANNATVMAVSLTGLVRGGLYGSGDVFVHLWVLYVTIVMCIEHPHRFKMHNLQ